MYPLFESEFRSVPPEVSLRLRKLLEDRIRSILNGYKGSGGNKVYVQWTAEMIRAELGAILDLAKKFSTYDKEGGEDGGL